MWGVAAGEGAVMVSVSSVFEWSVSRQCLVTWVEMCVSVRLRVCDEEPGTMGIQTTVGQKGCHRGQIYGRPATAVAWAALGRFVRVSEGRVGDVECSAYYLLAHK